jgi:hypothetical protein
VGLDFSQLLDIFVELDFSQLLDIFVDLIFWSTVWTDLWNWILVNFLDRCGLDFHKTPAAHGRVAKLHW